MLHRIGLGARRWVPKRLTALRFEPLFCLGLLILSGTARAASAVFPGAAWEVRTPSQVGLDSLKLEAFVSNVGGVGVIVKDGYLVRTWGDPASKNDWGSAAKPVVSTLLFFAVHEGKLSSLDDLVRPYWQDGQGNDLLLPKDQAITFRHLADMTSGYARGEAPGEAYAYNDYAIKLYKVTLFDKVFNEGTPNDVATAPGRLGALQFQDGSIFSSRGGYGVSTSPRDFARIGWFWLQRGNWNGQQLLPESYFDMGMRSDVPGALPRSLISGSDYLGVGSDGGGSDQTPYGPGIYGFNWWFNSPVGTGSTPSWPGVSADVFQANGHWGLEVLTVFPSLGLVAAARGNWGTFEPGNASSTTAQNLRLLAEAAGLVTGAEASVSAPVAFLGQNRPNPFHSGTTLEYGLRDAASVVLRVYSVDGRVIRTLVRRELPSGRYQAEWDGRDGRGMAVGAGIYLVEFIAGGHREVRKLALLR